MRYYFVCFAVIALLFAAAAMNAVLYLASGRWQDALSAGFFLFSGTVVATVTRGGIREIRMDKGSAS